MVSAAKRLTLPFLYVTGIWTAILLGTVFTGIYAWRVAEEARQLAEALAATERVLAREQHLSQLDGLAAAAAHELGTPLATIALVVKELHHSLPKDGPVGEDLRLLREQVERCRGILTKLTSMGQEDSAFLETVTLSHLVEEIVEPQRALDLDVAVKTGARVPSRSCGAIPAWSMACPTFSTTPPISPRAGSAVEAVVGPRRCHRDPG